MKKITLLFLVLLFGLTGCSVPPGNDPAGSSDKPDDFSISLDWATGPMPDPQMYYSYRIQVGPSDEGRLHYQSGDRSLELDAPFSVSEESLTQLYKLCYENGVLRSTREEGEPLDGGPDISINILANGHSYAYPSVSELSENERNIAYAIADKVQELVPGDLWDEMNQLQLDYETSND